MLIDPRLAEVVAQRVPEKYFPKQKQVKIATQRRRRDYRSSWEAIMTFTVRCVCGREEVTDPGCLRERKIRYEMRISVLI